MKMKKFIAVLSMVAMIGTLAVGCGNRLPPGNCVICSGLRGYGLRSRQASASRRSDRSDRQYPCPRAFPHR